MDKDEEIAALRADLMRLADAVARLARSLQQERGIMGDKPSTPVEVQSALQRAGDIAAAIGSKGPD